MTKLLEYYETGTSDAAVYLITWYGQTFTIGTSSTDSYYTLKSVSLKLYRTGSPGVMTIDVYAVSPVTGKPTGPVLSTGLIDGNLLTDSSSAVWYNIPMQSCRLAKTSPYCVVVHCSGGVSNYVSWKTNTSGAYTGGTALASVNSGSTWNVISSSDFLFRIYGDERFGWVSSSA